MQADDFEDHLTSAMVTRPALEQAKGVLVSVRCETPEEAHEEIRRVAEAHDVRVKDLAAALVEIAAGERPASPLLRKIVWQEWADVLHDCPED